MRLIAPSRWTVRMAGAALAVALAAASVRAQSLDVLPASGEWVTDRADLLTPTQRTALSARLDAFEDSTSNQIVVVILPTLNGADAGQYATELGQRWGVGQGQRDNGIVVLVSVEDRQLFIAPGYGLEGAVPDVVAGRIVRNVMVPRFREGRFYEGIDAGVTALMAATRGEYEALPAARPTGVNPVVVFAAMLAVIFLVGRLLQRGGDDD
ncbi:MAG TPA: TPM domain-containing protein, partial [Rubricoccaceae bacterium]|nr:TPM domain-containing protein [Rubricoccaceae bacterium]